MVMGSGSDREGCCAVCGDESESLHDNGYVLVCSDCDCDDSVDSVDESEA